MRFLPALTIAALLVAAEGKAAATVEPWTLPARANASQPNLSLAPDGGLNLSWIERDGEGHRLRFSRYANGKWSAAGTIASGSNWFVNWADFPSTTQLPDGTLWAHNLVKRGTGTYAYDVVLYRSRDGGASWSKPLTVHDDGTETEHGFATLWPWSASELAVAWLDGRETAGASGHDHGHHEPDQAGGKAMTLRAAVFDGNGQRRHDWRLDARTCDCCQTDAALTPDGPVLIYRDRSPEEIRDIHVVRHTAAGWLSPQQVARDGWLMPACPVNGPAIAAAGDAVWAAWYTGANDMPSLRVAFSADAGRAFPVAKTFASGPQIHGRVDLAADKDGVWLLWLQENGPQSLWLVRLDKRLQAVAPPVRVAQLQGKGRATGFARVQAVGRSAYVVWTDIVAGKPQLRGARVRL